MESENLKLWNRVYKTDPKHTKEVNFGRKFTSICAYYQIENATEEWGQFGEKWGVKDEMFNIRMVGDDRAPTHTFCLYTAILYNPSGNYPIHSDIEIIHSSGSRDGKYNDDWAKKVATDALTKGLSMLGFNADIFQGKFEDKYYIMEMNDEFGNAKKPQTISPDQIIEIRDLIQEIGADEIKVMEWISNKFSKQFTALEEIYDAHYDYIIKKLKERKMKGVKK